MSQEGDLGLRSPGKQGLCRAGIAPAAVGPGGLDLPAAGEGSPVPCCCCTPDSRRHTAQPRTRPLLQGRLREPRGQDRVC